MSNTNFRRLRECCLKKEKTGYYTCVGYNFSDPNILKTSINMISKSPKKIFYFSEATVIDIQFQLELMSAYKL